MFKHFYIDASNHESLADSAKIVDQQLAEVFSEETEIAEEETDVIEEKETVTPLETSDENTNSQEETSNTVSFTDDDVAQAILFGDTAKISTYLENGLSPNHILYQGESGERTLLLLAVANAQNGSLQTLLEYNADPNLMDSMGISPLMGATISHNKQAVELLLSFGADRMLKNKFGVIAYEMAASKGYDDLIPLLTPIP